MCTLYGWQWRNISEYNAFGVQWRREWNLRCAVGMRCSITNCMVCWRYLLEFSNALLNRGLICWKKNRWRRTGTWQLAYPANIVVAMTETHGFQGRGNSLAAPCRDSKHSRTSVKVFNTFLQGHDRGVWTFTGTTQDLKRFLLGEAISQRVSLSLLRTRHHVTGVTQWVQSGICSNLMWW